MNQKIKTGISKGMLGGAIGLACAAAYIGVSKVQTSELWMYIFMGSFLLFAFLHLLFRDEDFDKLQAINKTIWVLLPWLAFLFLIAFMAGAYVAMFISLGFLIVIYLIHLLLGVLQLENENAG